MTSYQVGFIGLGKIAAGYASPGDATPYCHAGGVLHAPKMQLCAAADPFASARQNFCERWGPVSPGVSLFDSLEAMLEAEKLDVIAVCVRGPHHAAVMRQVIAARPRAVFLEKPPTCSLGEMDEILALARENEVAIVASYSRHWSPRVLQMERWVRDGGIGEVHTVVGYCGGPVLSYASHTTDLICQFAGAQSGKYAPAFVAARGFLPLKSEVPAEFAARGYEVEPHLERLQIEFQNGVTGLQIGARGEGGEFYADVFGTQGRARVGMYADPQAFDLKNQPLDLAAIWPIPDQGPFTEAYNQIAAYLDGGALPACAGEGFVAVNEIGFGAIESLLTAGARFELPGAKRDRKIYANG